ncbi:MAG: bifunctional 3-deoxy-7-phosphoheptulonate synthase/chorismate mutase type II [Bacteroidales bacterium]|nr:bifunctional 3-deoxy-7-phosphoheptulonate synthase/chorismate mutase type II [Bacteroidales bacterium]
MNVQDNITLIAGPCSAESKEQLFNTASELKKLNIKYFRAGIWKPRTRPGDFEGVGSIGLKWLQEVKSTFGIPVATEVASTKHVEEALKAGIDMLWLGTRTTTNPFLVQEIAESLRGVTIPIMIKNPINPDLKLWLGAFERFSMCGIHHLSAIHRGFSVYERIKYRNNPNWQIAIDFKHEMPETPMICDPSHIAGKRSYVQEISQKALDLNFDGLFIESHYQPDKALTDSEQQLSPSDLETIIEKLILRQRINADEDEINEYRNQIDVYDENLIQILKQRMEISKKIGEFKAKHNLSILQSVRWEELLLNNLNNAQKESLSEQFALQLFKLIHQESINIQEDILSKNTNNESR